MRSGNFARGDAGTSASGGTFGRRDAFGTRPSAGFDINAEARAAFAAAHDAAAQAGTPGSLGPDWAAKLRSYCGVAAIVAGMIAYVVFSNIVHPIHYWDAVVLVGIAVLPTECVILFFFAEDHPLAARNLWTKARAGGPFGWAQSVMMAGLFGVGVPAALFLYANERLDAAPATSEVLTVQSKWTHTHRSSTTYYLGVDPTARTPSPFFSFYDDEPVRVSEAQWEAARPGTSQLTLAVHPGRFGLAWITAEGFTP